MFKWKKLFAGSKFCTVIYNREAISYMWLLTFKLNVHKIKLKMYFQVILFTFQVLKRQMYLMCT